MKVTCLKLILVSCLVTMDLLVPAFSQVKPAENTQPGNSLPATQRTSKITSDWADRAQFSGKAVKPAGNTILWYRQSARVWEEALPLGNGRLGAMIFGGVADERIQLNESTLWDGYTLDPDNPESLKSLPEVRSLLFADKNNEAVELAAKTMMGHPSGVKPYQSLGELWFDTPLLSATGYVRSLDLSTALATVKYQSGGVEYTRESFASAVDGVIVVRLSADKAGKINFRLTLKRQQDAICSAYPGDPLSLILQGQLPVKDAEGHARGIRFAAQVKALAEGGKVTVANGLMTVQNATVVTLFIAGATNYPGLKNLASKTVSSIDPLQQCRETINKADAQSYARLKTVHITEYQHFFNRVAIHFGSVPAEILALPTNERLDLAKQNGHPDDGMVETFFQYGRYLLISSSRPGNMPANLQGLWAWQMNPP